MSLITETNLDRRSGVMWYISANNTENEENLEITQFVNPACDQFAIYYDIYGQLNNSRLDIFGSSYKANV